MANFCPECGAPLDEGARFCGSCGTPLEAAEQQVQATAPVASRTPTVPEVPAAPQAPATPQAKTYQCPNCGGVASFDAAQGKLVCSHCGHVFEETEDLGSLPVSDAPVHRAQTKKVESVEEFLERAPWEAMQEEMENTVSYSCPSCAAQIVADQSTIATQCPYCGNNMLVSGIATRDNMPKQVLPFSVTREQAEQRLNQHFEHKWYLSRSFEASLEHLQGMYIPYHLFDIDVSGWADYVGYHVHHNDEGEDTRTYYAIKRAGHASFERIPIHGSSKMPTGHMDAIAPFDFAKMKDFSPQYAAGYLMEVADEDAEECLPRAKERAVNSFEEDLAADASRESGVDGIEETVAHQTDAELAGLMLCALPVWMMHCSWNEHQMLFAVNGETGRCVGDLPVDGKRRATTIACTLLVTLVVAVVLYIAKFSGTDGAGKFLIGALVAVVLITFGVDAYFMGQMRTAVQATNADMSYNSEGLVVTESWRSWKSYSSARKARSKLD